MRAKAAAMQVVSEASGEPSSLASLISDARRAIKRLGLFALSTSGANRLTRYALRQNLLALTYHRVVPRDCCVGAERPPDSIFADEFEKQIAFVARHFNVIGGNQLRAIVEGTAAIPRYSVVITFDDGYENNSSVALPILQRYGLTAVFFVTTNHIGRAGQFLWFVRLDKLLSIAGSKLLLQRLRELDSSAASVRHTEIRRYFKRLSSSRQSEILEHLEQRIGQVEASVADRVVNGMMNWDQVRGLASAGMTVGSHTANHQILAAVSPSDATVELACSRKRIEQETAERCWCFAYPNGQREDFRPSDEVAARDAGYSCAFTQVEGTISDSTPRYALPRIPIPGTADLKLFEAYVFGCHHLFKGARLTAG
jgi:peptidoglycan/xylan/chitin deacetylase (PgdA/CDA1 family)